MSTYEPIAAGLSAVKTGFELIKLLRTSLTKQPVDHHEIANKLMEIQQLFLDAQEELNHADDYTRRLESEINDLTRYADVAKDFTSHHGLYWKDDYPYCPVCWEVERKPTRLGGPAPDPLVQWQDIWTCPFHKAEFSVPGDVKAKR